MDSEKYTKNMCFTKSYELDKIYARCDRKLHPRPHQRRVLERNRKGFLFMDKVTETKKNPYIEDSYLETLTIEDLHEESSRDIINIIDDIIDNLDDWDVLSEMRDNGEDVEFLNREELASAILENVIMSIKADRQMLIDNLIELEHEMLTERDID